MRTSSTAVGIALSFGLVTGVLAGYGGAAGPDVGRPAAAVAAVKQKTKVPGHQIRIVLAGDRLGQRAKIRLVGVKGKADGVTKVAKVETTKRVKHLRPGRYRIVPRTITTAAGRATAKTVTVTVTARRGAFARIIYRFTKATPPPVTPPPTPKPQLVPKPIRPETITVGYVHTCGLDVAGKAWCWGDGSAGQLGDGDMSAHDTGTPVAVAGGHTFTSLTARWFHTCGLDDAGKAWCWGSGEGGVMGDGDTSDHGLSTPTAVVGGHIFSQLAAGYGHVCGLDGARNAWCWGFASDGQLGDGNDDDHATGTPVAVVGGHTFAALTAGYEQTCGIDDAGNAWCWGLGTSGALGDGVESDHDTGTPVAVVGGHTFTSLTAGHRHTCGIDDAMKAWCWGVGYEGLLGDGDSSGHDTATPVAVVGGHTFSRLTAGYRHMCGIDAAGMAWCWGFGFFGQLGDADLSDHATGTPVAVVGGQTFSRLTAGHYHTCALDSAGKAWCWGLGTYGTLGDGIVSDHRTATPVAVVGGHTFAQP